MSPQRKIGHNVSSKGANQKIASTGGQQPSAAVAVPLNEKPATTTRAALAVEANKSKPRSSRRVSQGNALVCRYCGSEDLAPSSVKRRDARCRACFKKRYGSANRKHRTGSQRKASTAK